MGVGLDQAGDQRVTIEKDAMGLPGGGFEDVILGASGGDDAIANINRLNDLLAIHGDNRAAPEYLVSRRARCPHGPGPGDKEDRNGSGDKSDHPGRLGVFAEDESTVSVDR